LLDYGASYWHTFKERVEHLQVYQDYTQKSKYLVHHPAEMEIDFIKFLKNHPDYKDTYKELLQIFSEAVVDESQELNFSDRCAWVIKIDGSAEQLDTSQSCRLYHDPTLNRSWFSNSKRVAKDRGRYR
jgi:hypothetical protein